MEGVRIYDLATLGVKDKAQAKEMVLEDLKRILIELARYIFGEVEYRWNQDYFPFTQPSLQLEILYKDDWLEILGCGVIHDDVLDNAKRNPAKEVGYAFGLGLERWAMKLFNIPDIRLFWSEDPRFLKQFKQNQISQFKEYSKYPACYKDITFWVPQSFIENDLFQAVRNIAGDLVETVECIDSFFHPKKERLSKCFRINYRSMDKSLTNAEVDELQFKLRDYLVQQMKCELR